MDYKLLSVNLVSFLHRYVGNQIFITRVWDEHFKDLNKSEKKRFLQCLIDENLIVDKKKGKYAFYQTDEQFFTAGSLQRRCELHNVFKPHTGGRQKGYKLSSEARAKYAEKRKAIAAAKKENAEMSLLQTAASATEQIIKVRSYLTDDNLKEVISCLQEEQTLRQERKARQEKLQTILSVSELSIDELKNLIKEVESC